MAVSQNSRLKAAFLIAISGIICLTGLLYGLAPSWFARTYFGMPALDGDFRHILRAVMGLYLAFAGFWLFSAFRRDMRKPALLTVVIFCAGLAGGRIVSFEWDGWPAPFLISSAVVELAITLLAAWLYKRPD